ncbi:hypothetical protein [[Kitasatospora] papulosa]|uniref:hypothetical protein n=1 Tax=[Kitasatospora] papulosa TaxID=1464011 RepID=UPI0036ABA0A7
MTQRTELDDDETAVRARLFGLLDVRLPEHEDDEQPAAVAAAPVPEPVAPEPVALVKDLPRVSTDRLPDWRDPHKPELSGAEPEPSGEPEPVEPEPGAEPEPVADDGEPAESRARRVLRLVKGERPDQDDDQDDEDEDDQDDDDEDDQAGEKRPAEPAPRPPGNPGFERPAFATPAFPAERKSVIQAVRQTPPEVKWLIFQATGLVVGFYFRIPQFAHEVTRSVAESPLGLRDNPDAYFWGVGLLLVLIIDRRTRRWWLPLSWATRAITTSVLIGAALHGNPIPH